MAQCELCTVALFVNWYPIHFWRLWSFSFKSYICKIYMDEYTAVASTWNFLSWLNFVPKGRKFRYTLNWKFPSFVLEISVRATAVLWDNSKCPSLRNEVGKWKGLMMLMCWILVMMFVRENGFTSNSLYLPCFSRESLACICSVKHSFQRNGGKV